MKVSKYINKVQAELTKQGFDELLIDDIVDNLVSTIDQYYEDWENYENDRNIFVYTNGEDYELFVDNERWQRRERVKMLKWKLVVSFWLSEVLEDEE